jgi:glycosyl transferase family 25
MIDLKKYFDKIYCINLDSRPDRWESVQKEFDKWGITDVERFSAINGNELPKETLKGLLPGEVGVLLTHLELARKCKEEGLNNVLILEDDVYFSEEILKLDEYMSKLPEDWEMLYLGGNHHYGDKPEIINDKILKLNFTVALHCVAINKPMFDVIEAILKRFKKQVDTHLAEIQPNFNVYGFHPNMAFQTAGFSDIQNRDVNYDRFFK